MNFKAVLQYMTTQLWAMQPDHLKAMSAFFASDAAREAAPQADRFTPAQDRRVAEKQGSVMVLPLKGVITNRVTFIDDLIAFYFGGTSVERFRAQFMAALADDEIKAIVLDVDSPGGTVGGVTELSELIYNSRSVKPIVAVVDDGAFSAAYHLATAAQEVVLTPSGMVGSIGVFMMHEDISKYLEDLGVKETFISAGEYKVEGNPFEPLTDEAKTAMQAHVDRYYADFVASVARNRGVTAKAVENDFGKGRVVGAADAKAVGMVDRLGTMQDTLVRFGVSMYSPGAKKRTSMQRMAREIDLIEVG